MVLNGLRAYNVAMTPMTITPQATQPSLPAGPVALERPRENERITSPVYTFRVVLGPKIGSRPCRVEIRIDNGAVQPCRAEDGGYCYEWSGYKSGPHQVSARVRTPEGLVLSAAPRNFWIALESGVASDV